MQDPGQERTGIGDTVATGEDEEAVSVDDGAGDNDFDNSNVQSNICRHLLSNATCRSMYDDNSFTVLSRASTVHHLKVLEDVFLYTRKPNLCVQKSSTTKLTLLSTTLQKQVSQC